MLGSGLNPQLTFLDDDVHQLTLGDAWSVVKTPSIPLLLDGPGDQHDN